MANYNTDTYGSKYYNFTSYDNGRQAIIAFHNYMTSKYKDVYNISLTELISGLVHRKGQAFFIEGLGDAITLAEMSPYQVKDAMEWLARQSGGKIPATNGAFYSALQEEASQVTWIASSGFALKETAKTVLNASVNVGDKLIGVGEGVLDSTVSIASNLKWILPATLFLVVGIVAFNKTK